MHLIVAEPDARRVSQRDSRIKTGGITLSAAVDCDPLARRRFIEDPLSVTRSAGPDSVQRVPLPIRAKACIFKASVALVARQHHWSAETADRWQLSDRAGFGI